MSVSDKKKDYMRRLIKGIRIQESLDPDTIKARKDFGDDVTTGRWTDVELLCITIEQEILNNDTK